MNILVVGQGGREHALAWKALRSAGVERVLVAPGNAGTARESGMENVAVAVDDFAALADLARRENVALTLVGPEAPLVAGIRDHFDAEGLACFGPTAAAARLEGSKAFSKDFLARHGIPTGGYRTFTDSPRPRPTCVPRARPSWSRPTGLPPARAWWWRATSTRPGRGARHALRRRLRRAGRPGGDRGVPRRRGGELHLPVRRPRALPFASSQDHKARDDGDKGPNTGGMGAYSPAPVVTRPCTRASWAR
jgi:phosphoribosylamine---glycine ligase